MVRIFCLRNIALVEERIGERVITLFLFKTKDLEYVYAKVKVVTIFCLRNITLVEELVGERVITIFLLKLIE